MSQKLKCKGCGKVMKPEDLEIKIGDPVIVDCNLTSLSNSGIILPFCKVCIENLVEVEDDS
ncbi:hypothetical protein LCGC14_1031230 [marine sediment metagenome]|uniref:Uncharacterized protein n=1 Tax=marine sediment metagenome TaxID=412755 RepID=A0A0F9MZ42_9ZZZZ